MTTCYKNNQECQGCSNIKTEQPDILICPKIYKILIFILIGVGLLILMDIKK